MLMWRQLLSSASVIFFKKEMAEILNDPHVYSFLHVPVQSAADPVLAAMKRDYTVAQFKELVDYLREQYVE